MKKANHSNALLVELLIVVMFFMLASTVLLQVYSSASEQGLRAGKTTQALNAAQNAAERLYAAEDARAALAEMGFEDHDGRWERQDGDYLLTAVTTREERPEGVWHGQEVQVILGGETLITLPCSRYEEGQL